MSRMTEPARTGAKHLYAARLRVHGPDDENTFGLNDSSWLWATRAAAAPEQPPNRFRRTPHGVVEASRCAAWWHLVPAFCDIPDHAWSVLNVGTFPSAGGTGSAYRQGRGSLGRSDHDTRSGRSPLIGS